MASAEKKLTTPDAATLALWRVAEDGEVEELVGLLPRVRDINARNEHGVTALMRAAQNGHVQMVRALLGYGAEANIKRNDKFTALALAAFFGHTEVVRTLMEHGADSQAPTRGGTSPQMWATARTFAEVVNQLEKPAAPTKPAPVAKRLEIVKEAPAMDREEPLVVRNVPTMVRTLKDPPEIWDLVHEAPRSFDPRSAFLTRLQSMKTSFVFRAATAVVLIGVCVVGVLVLRGVQARSERTAEPQRSDISQPVSSQRTNVQADNTSRADNTAHAIAEPAAVTTSVAGTPATGTSAASATGAETGTANQTGAAAEPETKRFAPLVTATDKSFVVRKFGSGRVVSSHRVEQSAPRVVASEAEPVAPPSENPRPSARVEATAKPKANAPLSPQLITPAKSPATKAKVIQWP